MAIEDAAVLGCLFLRLRARDRIASLPFAFQECAATVALMPSRRSSATYKLFGWNPATSETPATGACARSCGQAPSRGRNTTWKRSGRCSARSWPTVCFCLSFYYSAHHRPLDVDACQAADERWLQWGSLREKAKRLTNELPDDNRASIDSVYTVDVIQEVA